MGKFKARRRSRTTWKDKNGKRLRIGDIGNAYNKANRERAKAVNDSNGFRRYIIATGQELTDLRDGLLETIQDGTGLDTDEIREIVETLDMILEPLEEKTEVETTAAQE